MTYEQIQAGLKELRLAMHAAKMRTPSAQFTVFEPLPHETAHCAVSLWYDPLLCKATDDGHRMLYGTSAEDAFAKAANWIAGLRLWTPQDVARTLGVAAE